MLDPILPSIAAVPCSADAPEPAAIDREHHHAEPPLPKNVTMSPSRSLRKFARAGRRGSCRGDSPNFLCFCVYSDYRHSIRRCRRVEPIAASCRTAFSSDKRQGAWNTASRVLSQNG
jgi:hypothetical protein